MLSAVILSRLSYPAVPLAGQPVHQRSVLPSPLVLGKHLLKIPAPTADRDRPGSRRSEPSSRTTLIGGQPHPWGRPQPTDVMGRRRSPRRPDPTRGTTLTGEQPPPGDRLRPQDVRGRRRSQGFGCSPIKVVRELG